MRRASSLFHLPLLPHAQPAGREAQQAAASATARCLQEQAACSCATQPKVSDASLILCVTG
jgi:hypothetical protein